MIGPEDNDGFFGPMATLRFKVGYGIVDATGAVTKDTVPPGDVVKLRAVRAGAKLLVTWAPVSDPIGLRGYKVTAPGLEPVLVKGASVKLPLAGARGKKVTVTAVDEAGNPGNPGSIVARG